MPFGPGRGPGDLVCLLARHPEPAPTGVAAGPSDYRSAPLVVVLAFRPFAVCGEVGRVGTRIAPFCKKATVDSDAPIVVNGR